MRSKAIEFKNRKGTLLSGALELPAEGSAQQFALFAHCFTCSKDLHAVRNITRALSAQGFGVLRFDLTGLGRSEGAFKDSHFTANIEDLQDASAYLEEHYKAPVLIIGHSLGGAAAIIAAAAAESVKAVVTIGTPAEPAHVKHLLGSGKKTEEGNIKVEIGGRPFEIGPAFADHLTRFDVSAILGKMRKAILVCHSPQDTIVSIDNAALIYQAAHHPKSFLSLDGADHLLSRQSDSLYVGKMIATWVSRYIDPVQKDIETDEQVVVSLSEPGFTSKVKAGVHRLLADEPVSVGGLNMGPAPYDFVSIGLAACTAMTIRMYGDRKGWPIDEVNVHVSHGKVHAEDCADCENKNAKVDQFERTVELIGDLDEEQLKRIMVIADKCPVHRTLEASAQISTKRLGE